MRGHACLTWRITSQNCRFFRIFERPFKVLWLKSESDTTMGGALLSSWELSSSSDACPASLFNMSASLGYWSTGEASLLEVTDGAPIAILSVIKLNSARIKHIKEAQLFNQLTKRTRSEISKTRKSSLTNLSKNAWQVLHMTTGTRVLLGHVSATWFKC